MALGNLKTASLSCSSRDECRRIHADVEGLFRSPNQTETPRVLQRYNMDYIYLGPDEASCGGSNLDKYRRNPTRFKPVYSQDGVEIYRVSWEP